MSFTLKRKDGEMILPKHDAMQFDDGRYGIINGCELQPIGNGLVSISSGYIAVHGRLIEVTEQNIRIDYDDKPRDYMYIICLENGGTDLRMIISEVRELVQQEDFNYNTRSIFEVALFTLTCDNGNITNFVERIPRINALGKNLTAEDGLQFRFATDGEGNHGYLGADDSFIPFKSEIFIPYMAVSENHGSADWIQPRLDIRFDVTNYKTLFVESFSQGGSSGSYVRFYLDNVLYKNTDYKTVKNMEIDISNIQELRFYIAGAAGAKPQLTNIHIK